MSRPMEPKITKEKQQSVVMMPVQTLKNLLQKLKEKTESHVKSVIILIRKPQDHHQLDHVHEYMQHVPEKLHKMIHTQSKTPVIIFSTVLILISILLTGTKQLLLFLLLKLKYFGFSFHHFNLSKGCQTFGVVTFNTRINLGSSSSSSFKSTINTNES